MSSVTLRDILISARQESHRMRHFHLGIEHLLTALLEIDGGLLASLLTEDGYTPDYIIDAIRRKTGKGSKHRLWAGVPNTPRCDIVLSIAHDLALEEGRHHILERDLLLAILEENDSIPIRVMRALNIDLDNLQNRIINHKIDTSQVRVFVKVTFSASFENNLDKEHLFILRRMFNMYSEVRVESRLFGGYTSSLLLVVTPIRLDGRQAAPVVVKIDQTDFVQDEAQRYERYVKDTLPPLTARLEDRPTAPESSNLAGLKYTFITDAEGRPRDLRASIGEWAGAPLGAWLRDQLFAYFGSTWWEQSRPYRFHVWQEYDWVLPPMLTLDAIVDSKTPSGIQILRSPIRPRRITQFSYGDPVMIENFTVQKVDVERGTVQLALGQGHNRHNTTRAYQIEVRGIDFDDVTFYRGEVVERLLGRVWKTRQEQLSHALRQLEPDFDTGGQIITVGNLTLPNPLLRYPDLLDQALDGTISTIHGDLHLGNIMIGPNDSPLLIDFGRTREGHTLFDWVCLEISLLADQITPRASIGWPGARQIMSLLHTINQGQKPEPSTPELDDSLQTLYAVRHIAANLLAVPGQWSEYHAALAICALRAMNWKTMTIQSRRVMYLTSAIAMQSYFYPSGSSRASDDLRSTGSTDFMTDTD